MWPAAASERDTAVTSIRASGGSRARPPRLPRRSERPRPVTVAFGARPRGRRARRDGGPGRLGRGLCRPSSRDRRAPGREGLPLRPDGPRVPPARTVPSRVPDPLADGASGVSGPLRLRRGRGREHRLGLDGVDRRRAPDGFSHGTRPRDRAPRLRRGLGARRPAHPGNPPSRHRVRQRPRRDAALRPQPAADRPRRREGHLVEPGSDDGGGISRARLVCLARAPDGGGRRRTRGSAKRRLLVRRPPLRVALGEAAVPRARRRSAS